MKTFLRTIGYSSIALVVSFFGTSIIHAQTHSVTTLPATDITMNSAKIGLEFSSLNFSSHGFAIKPANQIFPPLTGGQLPTREQVGDCVPNIFPTPILIFENPDEFYTQTTQYQTTAGSVGARYFYYACGSISDETGSYLIEGEVVEYKILSNFDIQGCTVQNVSFSEISGNGTFLNNNVVLTIQASGCNEGISIFLKAIETNLANTSTVHHLKRIDSIPTKLKPDNSGKISIRFKIGEDTCYSSNRSMTPENGVWGFGCISYIEIFEGISRKYSGNVSDLNPAHVKTGLTNPTVLTALREKGALIGDCQNAWLHCNKGKFLEDDDNNWKYLEPLLAGTVLGYSGECSILQNGIKWTGITQFGGGGLLIANKTPILHINTSNCKNIPLQLTIIARDTVNLNVSIDTPDNQTIEVIPVVALENEVRIFFRSHEDSCTGANDPNCKYFVQIRGSDGVIVETKDAFDDYYCDNTFCNDAWKDTLDFLDKGIILADCSGLCDFTNWKLFGIEGGTMSGETQDPEDITTTRPVYDEDSPCYVPFGGDLGDGTTAGEHGGYDKNCYELLAPLPGIGKERVAGSGRFAIFGLKDYQLGEYINSMFGVALGILMVLAVIMIIIAGVQYMTVESFYGKGDAKKKITSALMGLILALGIFLILNTINPRLLEVNFGKDIGMATLGIVNDPAEQDGGVSGTDIVISTPPTNICTNRKDRGNYGSGNHNLKYSKITETAQTVGLQDVKADGINVKEGTPMGTSIKYHTEQGLAGKLIELKDALLAQGIEIELTETFGPTILGHGSKCHYTSSCVDLATKNRQYPVDTVEKIIRAADDNGLVAHFEFSKTESIQDYQTMQNELHSRGIDKCMVLYVKHATAWHFSIYDKFNESLTL